MKADQPYYPTAHWPGVTHRDQLAMDLYAQRVSFIGDYKEDFLIESAKQSIRAADIFFEELQKQKT